MRSAQISSRRDDCLDGLTYLENYIPDDKAERLVREIGAAPWRTDLKRRVQHYGYRDDATRYKGRHPIENAFCRLKDFRRVATRYDKLARNFRSAVALATLVAFWL